MTFWKLTLKVIVSYNMEIIEIIFGLAAILCAVLLLIISGGLFFDEEYLLASIIFVLGIGLFVAGIIATVEGCTANTIHEVKASTVRIDTIVTTCREKKDTSYIIKYQEL